MSTFKESNKKIQKFLDENNLSRIHIEMYMHQEHNYVCVAQHEYDKLEEV